jgi:2-oxoglutarate ferredoxin oxidoreductase subunit delta
LKGRIKIDKERCKGCGLCITVCPKKNLEISDKLNLKGYYPARSKEETRKESEWECTGCAICAVQCPDVAIEVYRETKDKSEHKSHHHDKKTKKSKKS